MSNTESTQDPPPVHVFELRMDNPEDQDELNRRLRKPGTRAIPQNGPGSAGSANPAALPPPDVTPR